MTYSLQDGFVSKFSSDNGDGVPPESAKLLPSDSADYAKCGTGLVYGGPQERHNGWAKRALDHIQSSGVLNLIAKKVFGRDL